MRHQAPLRSAAIALLLTACTTATSTTPPAAPTPAAQEAPTVVDADPDEKRNPGLNSKFVNPDLVVGEWVDRFQSESREVSVKRTEIVAALDLKPGESVADVGAGTGLYLAPFADAVGGEGRLYAVDISPRFLDHLRTRVIDEKLDHVTVVQASAESSALPPNSVDVVFVCDTYHHIEQVDSTLTSLHAALKPGGRLYVLDFERIEGTSSEWILGHVRAGKEVFAAEIAAAGFVPDGELDVGLSENYMLRFRRE